jgi:hypothetical protein
MRLVIGLFLFCFLLALPGSPALAAQDEAASSFSQPLSPVAPETERAPFVGSWVGYKLTDLFAIEGPFEEFNADFLDGGDMVASLSIEHRDFYLTLKILGKWRVEEGRLYQKGVAVGGIDVTWSQDGEDAGRSKKDLDAFKTEQRRKIEQDPEFSKETVDRILFVDAGYMATRTAKNEVVVFKKK